MKRFLATSTLAALAVVWLPGCLLRRHADTNLPAPVAASGQPDKILYERAMTQFARGRYEVGRLTLQTLLNTYPDSEFLAKSKLAIADSYYNEGGVSGLTQAETEYKDFETFFPTAPEAPESQYRAGMCHFRLMGKPDRDRTEARLAEAEFKEFLMKYPDSKLMPRVKGRLREVQEVLGESDFRVAEFYYLKQSNRAALSRFQEIVDQYPDYSQAGSALWYLGQTYERVKDTKHAATYYAQVLTDYPLSPHMAEAKNRLIALHEPVPHATRATMARAQADEANQTSQTIFQKLGGAVSSGPNLGSTRHGPVHLGPKPSETVTAATVSPSPTPGGASIVAEPVNEDALKSPPAVETKPAATDAKPAAQDAKPAAPNSAAQGAAGSQDQSKQAQGSSTNTESTSSSDVPAKKHNRLHKLKKIIKPF